MIPIFSDIFRKSVCYAQNGCAAGDIAALILRYNANFKLDQSVSAIHDSS